MLANGLRTAALMAALITLFALIGQALGGTNGLILAFVIAIGSNFFSSPVLGQNRPEDV